MKREPSKAEEQRQAEDVEALARLRQVGLPDYTCKVLRAVAMGQPEEWVDDWVGVIPTEAQLREKYGGGRFHLRLQDARGKWVPGGSAFVPIAGPARGGDVAAAGPVVDPTIRYAFEMMAKLMDAKRPEPKPLDVPALIGAAGTFLVGIGTLFKGNGSDPIQLVREIHKLQTELTEPARDHTDNPFAPAIAGITELAKQLARVGDAPAANTRAPELPAGPTDTEPAPAAPEGEDMDWRKVAAEYVATLAGLCDKGRSAETYAEVALDQAEEQSPRFYRVLTDRLGVESESEYRAFCDQFFALYPLAAERRAWFQDMFDAARDMVRGDEPVAPAAPASPPPAATVKAVANAEGTPG